MPNTTETRLNLNQSKTFERSEQIQTDQHTKKSIKYFMRSSLFLSSLLIVGIVGLFTSLLVNIPILAEDEIE